MQHFSFFIIHEKDPHSYIHTLLVIPSILFFLYWSFFYILFFLFFIFIPVSNYTFLLLSAFITSLCDAFKFKKHFKYFILQTWPQKKKIINALQHNVILLSYHRASVIIKTLMFYKII